MEDKMKQENEKKNILYWFGCFLVGVVTVKYGIPLAKKGCEMFWELLKCWEEERRQRMISEQAPGLPSTCNAFPNKLALPTATPSVKQQPSIPDIDIDKFLSGFRNIDKRLIDPCLTTPETISFEPELAGFLVHPSVNLVLGWRGTGKSCLAWRIVEHFHTFNNVPSYAYRVPKEKQKLLPEWMGHVDSLEGVPNDSAVVIDESPLFFHSRDSALTATKTFSNFINLSRQKHIYCNNRHPAGPAG